MKRKNEPVAERSRALNTLIPYKPLYNHEDPLLAEFTYGDAGSRAKRLKTRLERGDYVFFHTSIGNKKCITAYYLVDRVLSGEEAVEDRNIVAKFHNPHIVDRLDGEGLHNYRLWLYRLTNTMRDNGLLDAVLRFCRTHSANPSFDMEVNAEHTRRMWDKVELLFGGQYEGRDFLDFLDEYQLTIVSAMFTKH
jgi:hypothetical protein